MEIHPEVLEFSAPFNEHSTKPLHLRNTTNEVLAYKIKTTAPKLYCVRPNASIIQPGESVDVSIIRQGKTEPLSDNRHKDKFLVLSTQVKDVDVDANFTELWSDLEKHHKESISQKKIRVSYDLNGIGSTGEEDGRPEESTAEAANFGTPAKVPITSDVAAAAASAAAVPVAEKAESIATGASHPVKSPAHPSINLASPSVNGHSSETSSLASGSKTGAGSASARSAATNYDDSAKREIAQANEKISSMSQELKGRKGTESIENSSVRGASPQLRNKPSGVPVNIALVLALIAFLIGWKLF